MVCLGNICRSPMAAAVGRAMVDQAGLGERFFVESFGTAGYHVGEAADARAVAALRRRGWPADAHRARRLTSDDIAGCELVLCADRSNVADVRRLVRGQVRGQVWGHGEQGRGLVRGLVRGQELVRGQVRGQGDQSTIQLLRSFDPAVTPGDDEVPDPWGGDSRDFDYTLDLIEAACRGLVERLAVTVP
jgi:protein-tyrosine phosphatase